MTVRNAILIVTLMAIITFCSTNFNNIKAAENSKFSGLSNTEYQNRRTSLRELIEPLDAIVILKAHTEAENINKTFEYLTGINSHSNPQLFDDSILIMSYRACFIILNAKDDNSYIEQRTWIVDNCGFLENQVLQNKDDIANFLKLYFTSYSLVLLEQAIENGSIDFKDKELQDWAKSFVKQPMFPKSSEFNPTNLILKIARTLTGAEKSKLEKASKILKEALKITAQYLPRTLPVPENAILIDKKMTDEIKSKVMSWMGQIQAKPVFNEKTNKLKGYLIQHLPNSDIVKYLQIYINDTIVSVNGKLPSFSSEIQNLMNTLSTAGGTLTVEIQRKDKIIEQVYYVVPPKSMSSIELEVFEHIFNKVASKLGADNTQFQIHHLVDNKFQRIETTVESYDTLMIKAAVSVDGYQIIGNQTINVIDKEHTIEQLETSIAKAALKIYELFEQKTTFQSIKNTVLKEFDVNVDFLHAGVEFTKIFPDEIYPLENSVYQILLSHKNYMYVTNSIDLSKSTKDLKTYKTNNISLLRKLSESTYNKFKKAGLEIHPEMYKPKDSDKKYLTGRIVNVSVGPFMTMPFQKDDLILNINSTRIFDLVDSQLIDKIYDLSQKPYVATVYSKGEIMTVITKSNFYKNFKLDHLNNLTDECFYFINSMVREKKYQNRIPMSNQAALTAGMISEFLKGMGYKTLPGTNPETDGYYLRSWEKDGRTDIAGILRNENSNKNVILEISIPYDFSSEKRGTPSEEVNTLLALGFGLTNILRNNPNVDILIHFYSQANVPIMIPAVTANQLREYKTRISVEFKMDSSIENTQIEYLNEKALMSAYEYCKPQLELFDFSLLSTTKGIGLAQQTLSSLDKSKDIAIRFVIPTKTKGNLELLKTARLVSLIPSIINAKLN